LPEPYAADIPKICGFIDVAVNKVKDLFDVGHIEPENRKQAATDLIIKNLSDANIAVDDKTKNLISVLIEALYQLPKISSELNATVTTPDVVVSNVAAAGSVTTSA
jgi:hypothetical protein